MIESSLQYEVGTGSRGHSAKSVRRRRSAQLSSSKGEDNAMRELFARGEGCGYTNRSGDGVKTTMMSSRCMKGECH